MNVAVINIKDIFKYFIKFIAIFSIIFILVKIINIINITSQTYEIRQTINNKTNKVSEYSFLECIEYSISFFNYDKNKKSNKFSLTNLILDLEIGKVKVSEKEEFISQNKDEKEIFQQANQKTEEIGIEVTTEYIEDNNIPTTYTNTYGTVEVKNNSDYSLTEEILIPNVEIINNKDILIFHTHTCESYTPSEIFPYDMTGNYRTTDLNYTVAKVGTELKDRLTEKGFNVMHNVTYHDYPAYSGCYTRSLETVSSLLKGKDTQIVIDLHRDAIGSKSTYAPTVKINDTYVAQMMFVIGTNGGGLEHPNWQQNLKLAVKIQEVANEMYPGLFRPINLTNSRYNQHIATGASIIEVGATGNTIDQCLLSMQCLANVLEKALK